MEAEDPERTICLAEARCFGLFVLRESFPTSVSPSQDADSRSLPLMADTRALSHLLRRQRSMCLPCDYKRAGSTHLPPTLCCIKRELTTGPGLGPAHPHFSRRRQDACLVLDLQNKLRTPASPQLHALESQLLMPPWSPRGNVLLLLLIACVSCIIDSWKFASNGVSIFFHILTPQGLY